MTITSAMCNSFKQEILVEGHNFTGGADQFKLSLYSSDSKKKTSDWKNVLKELKETFQVWSPPPRLTVTEWSEQFRRLSTEASSMPFPIIP